MSAPKQNLPSARWLPEDFWEFAKQYPNDTFEEQRDKYLKSIGWSPNG